MANNYYINVTKPKIPEKHCKMNIYVHSSFTCTHYIKNPVIICTSKHPYFL